MMKIKSIAAIAVALFVAANCIVTARAAVTNEAPKHEMRGAWVATVYGIDWPRQRGTDMAAMEDQKRELCEILDVLQSSGLNAVMFQVRSMCDAMYESSYEPWSAYLTGTPGAPPVKGWDPLAFAVEEAHARGMELHAWVNPFRLSGDACGVSRRAARGNRHFNPDEKGWVIKYPAGGTVTGKARKGKKRRRTAKRTVPKNTVTILDPGNPEAREHIVDVCRDIVTRYDVDGLIFDDYFYPDGLPLGKGYDYAEWKKECVDASGREEMSQADWRRANVGKTIRSVSEMLRQNAPWVRFGISPAGVGGGNGKATEPFIGLDPPSVGTDWMYDRIFCDPIDWLYAGTIDYVSPQIYWASDHETNPYLPIADWWAGVAAYFGRHCYPSQKVLARPETDGAWAEQRLQVEVNRAQADINSAGSIFYSTAHLTGKKASGLGSFLKESCYSSPALLPAMPWRKGVNPGRLKDVTRKGSQLSWYPMANMRYVVYAVPEEISPLDVISSTGVNFMAEYIVAVSYGHMVTIPADKLQGYWYAVAPYDRYGNEWEAVVVEDK